MNDDIDKKLAAWRVNVEVPARFRAGVWDRIASREAAREHSLRRRLAAWFALLARPQYAAALFAVMIFAGITAAGIKSRETNSAAWANLENRYAVSIDPRAHVLTMQ